VFDESDVSRTCDFGRWHLPELHDMRSFHSGGSAPASAVLAALGLETLVPHRPGLGDRSVVRCTHPVPKLLYMALYITCFALEYHREQVK
jgi:hypothetical protein